MARVKRASSRGGGRQSSLESHENPRSLRPKLVPAEAAATGVSNAPLESYRSLPPIGLPQSPSSGQTVLPFPQPPSRTSRYQPPFAGPQSPESTASTGSFSNSGFGLGSLDLGSVLSLERHRNLSPQDITPTHSLPSIDRSATQDDLSPFPNSQDRLAEFTEISSDKPYHAEPLAGISSIYEGDGGAWGVQREHESPSVPGMMLPSGLQHVRDFEEPWSALDVEEGESPESLGLSRSNSINTRTEQLSLSSRPGANRAATRPGRRHGPLSTESRQNANDVRKERSCLRCFVYKETCDTSKDICLNCSNKQARTWRMGCVRPRLMFRSQYLLPEVLSSRLERGYVDSFIQNRGWPCTDRSRFAIPLEIGLGPEARLILPVREYLPVGDLKRPAYLPVEGSNDANPINMYDLPVRISCDKESEAIHHIRRSLLQWYHKNIGRTQESNWAWTWFRDTRNPFPGEIMEIVCEYFDAKLVHHKPLKEALAVSFFNYIFINTFLVDNEGIQEVASKMENPPPPDVEYLSPSIMNLYIKMLMLPPLRDVVGRTLKGLELLLLDQQNPRVWRRDIVFCVSFIVLAYLARTQISILQFADQPLRENGRVLTLEDAEAYVFEMEAEVADLIIKYHHQFMAPSTRRKTTNAVATQAEQECEERAVSFGLMDRVRRVCAEHAHTRPLSYNPDCSNVRRFIGTNTVRLCWKLVTSILPGADDIKPDPDTEMEM